MDVVLPGLYASEPSTLPFDTTLVIRSFLLQRSAGNLLVYRADKLEQDAEAVAELGGVARQYLNHRHEASFSSDWAAERFGAPLLVHEAEAQDVSKSSPVNETFSERHRLGDDFEIIPTPGHTPGATAFLWDSGQHRALFTGDTIYFRGGEWVAAVLGFSHRERYIESLELIKGLDFDVLVPWAATAGEPYHAVVNRKEAGQRLDAVLERVRAGEDH